MSVQPLKLTNWGAQASKRLKCIAIRYQQTRQPPGFIGFSKRHETAKNMHLLPKLDSARLNAAASRAYKEGEIAATPYILPGSDSVTRMVPLTSGQAMALWDAVQKPHQAMYLALAFGLTTRPEAILGLHREYAALGRRIIDTNPPGHRQTKKYRPVIPIPEFLTPIIRNVPAGPLVQWKGAQIKSFKTAWRRMRLDAGLPDETGPKIMRHTMATEMRAADVPEAEIQGLIGHRAMGGVTEAYAQYRPSYLGKAVIAIDAYMEHLRVSCVLEKHLGRP